LNKFGSKSGNAKFKEKVELRGEKGVLGLGPSKTQKTREKTPEEEEKEKSWVLAKWF